MMRFEGSLLVQATADEVYSFVTDPGRIIALVPDIVESNVVDKDHFSVKAKAGVGPIRGTVDFDFAVVGMEAAKSVKLVGRGKGMQSNIDLTLEMTLEPASEGCNALWVADAYIGGTLAGIGGKLVAGLAEKYIRQLTDNLATALPPKR